MNPEPTQSATPPTPASPVPHHDPTRDELIELGMLAIEDANLAEGSSAPAIAGGPAPASTVQGPALTPTKAAPITPLTAPLASPLPPTAAPAAPIVIAPTAVAQPAAPQPAAPLPAGDVPAVSPATIVQPTTDTPQPTAQPSVPQTVDPGPDAWDKAAAAALPVQPIAEPAKPSGVPSVSPADIMEYSANSSQLKSISKLRRISYLLYAVILGLAVAIVAGGWYIYNMLGSNIQ